MVQSKVGQLMAARVPLEIGVWVGDFGLDSGHPWELVHCTFYRQMSAFSPCSQWVIETRAHWLLL